MGYRRHKELRRPCLTVGVGASVHHKQEYSLLPFRYGVNSGIARTMNSPKSGTVNAKSPCAGL